MRADTIKGYLKAGPSWAGDIAAACGIPFEKMESIRPLLNRMVAGGELIKVPDPRNGGTPRTYYKLAN